MTTLKLVGAQRFVCKPAGIDDPVVAGGTVDVEPQAAETLLARRWYDKSNNAHPVFSTDLDAPVNHGGVDIKTLEERMAEDKQAESDRKALAREKAQNEELRKQNEELAARMAAIEEKLAGGDAKQADPAEDAGITDEAEKPAEKKPAARKSRAKKAPEAK